MTRRLVATALVAASLGAITLTTVAHAEPDGSVCVGSDDSRTPGRGYYVCLDDTFQIHPPIH